MAHSRVFQFESVSKVEFEENDIEVLTECMLDKCNFPDPNWIDYWVDSEDSPKEDFKLLVNCLPNGMFEVNENELSLTYIKKPIEYLQQFVNTIQEEANKLSVEGFFDDKFSTWKLKSILRNNENDFIIYNYDNGYPIYCSEWIMGIARNCEIGKKFYLGGVLVYHY